MAGESDKDVDIAEKSDKEGKGKNKDRGLFSRIWNGLFGIRDDDFERRLERISKDESAILFRMRKRSQTWGRTIRHLILLSVVLEFFAVGYALVTARAVENWKKRALHVLPMFLFPAVSSITYTALVNFMKMCERKDQKNLENLRAERQSKIDEMKEQTNYYITQQLIHKYDTDPAAKAAAATILAAKLGAESGLKVYVEDDLHVHPTSGRSNDAEFVDSDGLRRRKQPRSRSAGSSPVPLNPELALLQQMEDEIVDQNQPTYVDHYQQGKGSDAYSSNWLARFAALLVGEDPTQCYALICGNCRMHNGLASKEDFPYLTYICPHCRAVNGQRKKDDRESQQNSPTTASTLALKDIKATSSDSQSPREKVPESVGGEQKQPSPATAVARDQEGSDKAVTSEEKES